MRLLKALAAPQGREMIRGREIAVEVVGRRGPQGCFDRLGGHSGRWVLPDAFRHDACVAQCVVLLASWRAGKGRVTSTAR